MSKSANSPTARLLRSSRLFSLPKPLPQQGYDFGTAGVNAVRRSDTATVPYPSYQAITTPSSSLYRGDFGLKRALPAKTTQRTSTPHILVRAQDTPQHITDFASAADHTRTEAKLQELAIPIVRQLEKPKPGEAKDAFQIKSVYESSFDNTFIPPRDVLSGQEQKAQAKHVEGKSKWKQDGSRVKTMSEGEFKRYLLHTVNGRKAEWRKFLADEITERKIREARDMARTKGETWDEQTLASMSAELRATDEEVFREEKDLRDRHQETGLWSDLTKKLCQFLDVPGMHQTDRQDAYKDARNALISELDDSAANDTFTTHPAAGLTHLRTNAIMENHPLHGPQVHRTPFAARVLTPRKVSGGDSKDRFVSIGLAGFAALHPTVPTRGRASDETGKMLSELDPDVHGGNKVWVHPSHATVDERGHVRLSVVADDVESVAVRTNDVEAFHRLKQASRLGVEAGPRSAFLPERGYPSRGPPAPRGSRDNANYGGALPDTFESQSLRGFRRPQLQPDSTDMADGWTAPSPRPSRGRAGGGASLEGITELLDSQPEYRNRR